MSDKSNIVQVLTFLIYLKYTSSNVGFWFISNGSWAFFFFASFFPSQKKTLKNFPAFYMMFTICVVYKGLIAVRKREKKIWLSRTENSPFGRSALIKFSRAWKIFFASCSDFLFNVRVEFLINGNKVFPGHFKAQRFEKGGTKSLIFFFI